MPTEETYYCNKCGFYRRAWIGDRGQCWDCDEYTLSSNNSTETAVALIRAESNYSALQSRMESQRSDMQELIRAGERELSEKNWQISNYSSQLTLAQNQLTTTQNQLVTKQAQHDELLNRFTGLQIESNNKDKKIEKIGKENSELKEENIRIKLQAKEGKLENFIKELGIRRAQARDLRNACQQLALACDNNYNPSTIRIADNKIEEVKDELLDGGVSVENMQNLHRRCEKIAKLKVELEKMYQERFEARQEVPHNNGNLN
jgi:chromosome segregation ATPase